MHPSINQANLFNNMICFCCICSYLGASKYPRNEYNYIGEYNTLVTNDHKTSIGVNMVKMTSGILLRDFFRNPIKVLLRYHFRFLCELNLTARFAKINMIIASFRVEENMSFCTLLRHHKGVVIISGRGGAVH